MMNKENKVFYAFYSNDCDEIIYDREMSIEEIIDEIVDNIGAEICDYPAFGHFVVGSKVVEPIDWSNKEMMDEIAEAFTDAYGEEITVVIDN